MTECRSTMNPRGLGDPARPLGALGRLLLLHRDRARRRSRPFTLVLIRVALAAAMLWAVPAGPRASGCRCRRARRSPSSSSRCSTTSSRSSCSPGRRRRSPAASPRSSTRRRRSGACSSPISSPPTRKRRPAKVAGVLLGFAGVAVMIGADLLGEIGARRAGPARLPRRDALLRARRRLGAALPADGRAAGRGLDRPAHRRRDRHAAAGAAVRAALAGRGARRPRPGWRSLALALFCTSLAYILYFRLLASAGATNSLLVTFLIPVTAILLGALFLGERLEPRQLRRHGADRPRPGGDRRAAAEMAGTSAGGRRKVLKLDQVDVRAAAVLRDLEQVDYAEEARAPRQIAGDVLERDLADGFDEDVALRRRDRSRPP